MTHSNIEIINFTKELAPYFESINMAWIEKYFTPEPEDLKVLKDPYSHIIQTGGYIVFAKYQGKIVGTCGLKKWSDTEYELVKMGVLDEYQGLKIGLLLGQTIIEKAQQLSAQRLFLETNSSLIPAIQLYNKLGFKEYKNTDSRCDYQRCDLIMEMLL